DPAHSERYLLVYGRRRLEAIRASDKVEKVRALVAKLDDDSAVRAQISENMARRDLSFIEKALFARDLVENGFGNQSQVAEVLTVSKSAISMAMAIVETVGVDLVRAIGSAHGIGRPRWDELGKSIVASDADPARLIQIAEDVHTAATVALVNGEPAPEQDPSVSAFDAVMKAVGSPPAPKAAPSKPRNPARPLTIAGSRSGSVKRTAKGVQIDLADSAFASWVEAEAEELIEELHARWLQRSEDQNQ
ncbi:ParB/RepB/Spo0J family partition protein, partial [Phaeobacter sp. HF9A]|uniref:ParB/RepB/Spo0J family partition protein n=1 Tax=Phaeobacter sp. HF9A TaxID=2721561 RepID=UPI00143086D4